MCQEAVKRTETQPISLEKNSSRFTIAIRSVMGLEEITGFISDPRKIDIYTIDVLANLAIARTTIELDSDVITVTTARNTG